MSRLGYARYGAQGSDTGSVVSPELGRIDPGHVIGVHVNHLGTFPSGDPGELAGQPAWIVEKFKEWTDPRAGLPEDAVGILMPSLEGTTMSRCVLP